MSYSDSWTNISVARRIGLGIVFFWFLPGGLVHFFATSFDLAIMPPWVPYPLAAVYVSGVLELIGAAGLLFARTRRAAAILLFLITLAVSPVHIYMLQVPEKFPQFPLWGLWLRLPIQVALLTCIWWSAIRTRPEAE